MGARATFLSPPPTPEIIHRSYPASRLTTLTFSLVLEKAPHPHHYCIDHTASTRHFVFSLSSPRDGVLVFLGDLLHRKGVKRRREAFLGQIGHSCERFQKQATRLLLFLIGLAFHAYLVSLSLSR